MGVLFAAEGVPRLLGQTGKKQYEGQITTLQEHASPLKDNWEPIVLQCLPPEGYVSQELKPLVKHVGSKGSTSQNNYGSSGAFSVACLENAPGCYVSGVFYGSLNIQDTRNKLDDKWAEGDQETCFSLITEAKARVEDHGQAMLCEQQTH